MALSIQKGFARLILLLFVFSFWLGVSTPSALAITGAGIGARPANPDPSNILTQSWFIYELDPGEIKEDAILLINRSGETRRLKIDPLDGGLSEDGGFGISDKPENNVDVGTWIELSATEVTLKPNEQAKIPFKVVVPEDTWVGDHFGGFGVYEVDAASAQKVPVGSGSTVYVKTRLGLRMYVTVRGDKVWNISLTRRSFGVSQGKLYLRLGLINKGNVKGDLELTGSIYSPIGLYDRQEKIPLGQIAPHQGRLLTNARWQGKNAPLFGLYLLVGTITDTAHPDIAKPIRVVMPLFFFPGRALLLILILLFVIWLIYQFVLWRRALKLARTKVVAYQVKASDSLMKVAAEFNLPWKLVARINNLNPPYELSGIKKLYLPDTRGERREGIKLPNYFAQISRPFATFGAWVLGRVFRIERFRPPLGGRPQRSETLHSLGEGGLPSKSYLTAIVEKGDTLSSIAKHFKVDNKKLISHNNLKFPFKLTEGQELKIPKPKQRKSQ